ncbi:hypothetical protein V6N11_035263 [Hibiscus sabdariffa]|uniref:Uncharacterized protein n=1 Tax=Hibiscus sabdariffa TaxID=183260 RepID=A0ABR2R031_9ROSI
MILLKLRSIKHKYRWLYPNAEMPNADGIFVFCFCIGSVPRLNSGGPNRVVTKNAAYLASNPEKKSRAPRNNAGRLEVVPMISVQQAVVVEHWLKSLVLTEQFQLYSGATVNMVRLGFQ